MSPTWRSSGRRPCWSPAFSPELLLAVTRKGVEAHLARLFERFGVQSRTELAVRAEREGWREVPPKLVRQRRALGHRYGATPRLRHGRGTARAVARRDG